MNSWPQARSALKDLMLHERGMAEMRSFPNVWPCPKRVPVELQVVERNFPEQGSRADTTS